MSTALVESNVIPPSNGFGASSSMKLSKAQKDKMKKKDRKKRKQERKKDTTKTNGHTTVFEKEIKTDESDDISMTDESSVDVEIEYVNTDPFESLPPEENDALLELKDVLSQFAVKAQPKQENKEDGMETEQKPEEPKEKLSKKKRKLKSRRPIAALKQCVQRPDLVEIHDTCAADPLTLLHLKAYHNSVPVPRHWSQKRKYLQGKRGIEKPPFDLPDFIKKTGIMEARGSNLEKDTEKTLKQKSRERLNPTMGKIGIDYQVLHDAFFRHQTKPKMAGYGDLYYEGKEFEVEMKEKRPGVLSKELKEALGIPEGSPPPWLINMQRVGPPPSYKNLKIPGLNAPIPPGAEYGYHPGGWGRPPSDENGRPLYAEAWGQVEAPRPSQYIEVVHWGALPEQLEQSEEEEEGEEQQEPQEEEERVVDYPGTSEEESSGIETPLSGIETPQALEANLRKNPKKLDESGDRQLYQVLEQREAAIGGELYGSSHTYVVDKSKMPGTVVPSAPAPTATIKPSAASTGPERVDLMKSQKTESVDIALDPNELSMGLSEEVMKKKYDKAVEDKKVDKTGISSETGLESEGGSGKKRKRSGKDEGKKSKKLKDGFQF